MKIISTKQKYINYHTMVNSNSWTSTPGNVVRCIYIGTLWGRRMNKFNGLTTSVFIPFCFWLSCKCDPNRLRCGWRWFSSHCCRSYTDECLSRKEQQNLRKPIAYATHTRTQVCVCMYLISFDFEYGYEFYCILLTNWSLHVHVYTQWLQTKAECGKNTVFNDLYLNFYPGSFCYKLCITNCLVVF